MHQTSSDQLSNTFRFAFYTVIIISFRNYIQNLKMNQMIIFALVLAVAAAAPQRPHNNRPGLFGQPGAVARPPVFANPLGSGTASGAGTANANAGGISVSGVAITSAQNGGSGHATGTGTVAMNVLTGEVSGAAGGSGESQGRK